MIIGDSMNELDMMINQFIRNVKITEQNISANVIYVSCIAHEMGDKFLLPLSAERLEKLDRSFDYEKDAFDCKTVTGDDKIDFKVTSGIDPVQPYRGRVILSIKDESIEYVVDKVMEFLVTSKIHAKGFVNTTLQNDTMTIALTNQEDINKLFAFIHSNGIISHLGNVTPIVPNFGGIGFANFSGRGNYIEKFCEYLAMTINSYRENGSLDMFSLESFAQTLNTAYQSGRTPNPACLKDMADAIITLDSLNNTKKK